MNSILKTTALMVALIFASVLSAQTGITLSVGSTADAVHYHGAWTVGSSEFATYDVKDSAADSNGYVNSIYLGALARNYGTAGFSTYGGYADYVPTKFVASVLKSTNIPTDSFRVYLRGGAGSTVPAVGNTFLTGFMGAGADVAINSSGSVVWNAIYGEWQNPGIVIVKSGLQVYFGGTATGTAQSSAAAKMRRALFLQRRKPE
jgi:hypothetical protein